VTHPIAQRVFEKLVKNADGFALAEGAEQEIELALSAMGGSVELVDALLTLASVAEFLSTRGESAARALIAIMLRFEDELRALNASLGAEVVEKRLRTTRDRADKLLGGFALVRAKNVAPSPAGVPWWSLR
jgi:hypothetical protein